MGRDTETAGVRERILEAALALLKRADARKLAQPRVAKAAGVPQGHLTYYFPKKHDLIGAVTARFVQGIRDELGPVVARLAGTVDDADRDEAVAAIVGIIRDREKTRSLLRLIVEADAEDMELAEILSGGTTQIRSLLAAVTRRDPADPQVDLALAATLGLAIDELLFAEHRGPDRTKEILAHFEGYLRGKPAG